MKFCKRPQLVSLFVGVFVLSLCFKNAERSVWPAQDVIGPATIAIEFKPDAVRVEKVPIAVSQGLVDENTGEGFRLVAHGTLPSLIWSGFVRTSPGLAWHWG